MDSYFSQTSIYVIIAIFVIIAIAVISSAVKKIKRSRYRMVKRGKRINKNFKLDKEFHSSTSEYINQCWEEIEKTKK